MKIEIELETGNAALAGEDGSPNPRIIAGLIAQQCEVIGDSIIAASYGHTMQDIDRIVDDNGNTVGKWKITL